MATKRDYYEILGVDRKADGEVIKKAYRKLAIKFHPDKNPDDPTAEDKFKEAAEAYSILSDETSAVSYDQLRASGVGSSAGAGGFGGGFTMEDIFSQFGDIFGGGAEAAAAIRSVICLAEAPGSGAWRQTCASS